VQPPIDPPDRWMPPGYHADEDLQDVDEVVPALDVSPFVNQDAVKFSGIERLHQRRRHGDHRRSASKRRGRRH
jgi:hypothetical protein